MDIPPINLISSAPLNDGKNDDIRTFFNDKFFFFPFVFLVVRELPILSLANPGMERLVDTSTAEYTSMLLNCRDGALAQQLAHKLSLVSNTTTSM